MKKLEPGTEVMLTLNARRPWDKFNPHYGLVDRDLGRSFDGNDWTVYVLWEDGVVRPYQREDLVVLSEVLGQVDQS